MRGSQVVAALVATLLLTFGGALASEAFERHEMVNIGFVLYTKGDAPGTLKARWNFANTYSGHGVATGGTTASYSGSYHVRYYLDSGEFSDEYDLVIKKKGEFYDVAWITDGKISAVGVGMEVENGLAVGWRRVAD